MNPMFIIAVPLVLVVAGLVWNSIGLSYDQPPSSPEPDLAKRAAAEGDAYRRFFDTKRKQSMTRQKRIGQYAWLLVVAFIGSFIWLYNYTVNKTTAATQIAALQTLPMEEGKELVLSVTLKDGSSCEIPDQSAHSRSFGRCHERRSFETESLILRSGTIRHDLELRRDSVAPRYRHESVRRPDGKKRLKAFMREDCGGELRKPFNSAIGFTFFL